MTAKFFSFFFACYNYNVGDLDNYNKGVTNEEAEEAETDDDDEHYMEIIMMTVKTIMAMV